MFQGWGIAALAVAYIGGLFLIAWLGDKARVTGHARPLIYSLSLAVYCTSWTFFGSVGLAAETGYDFIPVYLGPILVFLLGPRHAFVDGRAHEREVRPQLECPASEVLIFLSAEAR